MSHKRICILGESPLVEEYASLCLNKGFEVHVRMNTGESSVSKKASTALPKDAKKIARVTRTTDLALELTNISAEAKKKNLDELDKVLPLKIPILSSSVMFTVAEQRAWISRPARLIGLGALPSLLEGELIEFALSDSTDTAVRHAAEEFAKALGKESAIVADSVGLVLPRILCTLANEACFAIMESVAPAGDIDTAMKLGTNYPFGPLEWAERIGMRQVHAVMAALYKNLGEDRYRVAPLLRRAAALNGFPAK